MFQRFPMFRLLLPVLALGLVASCEESPTATRGETGHGPVLAKGGKPSSPATIQLPLASGADGLFTNGGQEFARTWNPDAMALSIDCAEGTFVLQRPAAWTVVSGTEVHCSGSDGFSRLDLNDMAGCTDLINGCPNGTSGHGAESGTGYSNDLNYYFRVKTGKGKTSFVPYNVVWTDGWVTVEQTDGSGTPCRWRLDATTAEFWDGGSEPHVLVSVEPMTLTVRIRRSDLCS